MCPRSCLKNYWIKGCSSSTKQKKNAKKPGMLRFTDRLLLRKRAVIESVNNFLKNTCQIEHSRHRSSCNFVVNLMAGLAAYSSLFYSKSHPFIIYTGDMWLLHKYVYRTHINLGVFYSSFACSGSLLQHISFLPQYPRFAGLLSVSGT